VFLVLLQMTMPLVIMGFDLDLVFFDLGWHTESLLLNDGQRLLLSKLVIDIHVVLLETQVMPISSMPHNVLHSVAGQGGRRFNEPPTVVI